MDIIAFPLITMTTCLTTLSPPGSICNCTASPPSLGFTFPGHCDAPSDFLCSNNNCIYSGFQCDGENDCGDMSDERQCDVECYMDPKGQDYRGNVYQTNYGITCQKWTSQSPHNHEYTPSNHPGKGLGEHNYCRNPVDNSRGPWCFTTDPNKIWQYCSVGEPSTLCNSEVKPSTTEEKVKPETTTSAPTVTTSTTEEKVQAGTTTPAPTVAPSTTEEKVQPGTTTSAPTDRDRELSELADVNITMDNVLIVATHLTILATDNVEIDDDVLEDISDILDGIVAVKDQSLNVTESVVNIVDNIIESYVGDKSFDNEVTLVPEAPNQIQRTLEQQITTLQTNPDIVNATIKARNVAIQAVKIPRESLVSRRLVFEAIPEGQHEILNTTVTTKEAGEQSEDEVEAAISFQPPFDIFSDINGNQSLAVSFSVYNDATLFPSTLLVNNSSGDNDQDGVQRIVASRVISATLEGIEVNNLSDDNIVETLFALNKINTYEGEIEEINTNTIECVFWDITASNGLGDWSNDGCQYNRTLANGRVVCHCNHLTSFAVLVDIHGKSSRILDIVSKVGCGISIACLIITLMTYLSARSLRNKKPVQILISFCFSLLLLYVVFVIGIERGTKPDVGCIIVSALLHYFTLTSIAWMAVEAFQMYCKCVNVVGRWAYISRFLLKASFLAWGLPAAMVTIVLIVDVNQYNNKNYCFIKIGYAFYFTHLLVLALVVGVNTVIFGLVMHRLTCGRNTNSSTLNKQEERQVALKRVQSAIGISLLIGLTWVFGLFALIHEDSSLVFQYFFCICNTCQGAFIFVMYCVRQPDVVAIWKERISCGKTNGYKGHAKKDVSQSSGVVSDTGRQTLSSDVATSKL